jgi:dolichyl-phosphate-mannose--protein O-mannosyl transferase
MFGPIIIAIAGFLLRVLNLNRPKGLVFDEIYYVDGARDYLRYGVEMSGANSEFIVHPPVGKWLIAIGIKLFGDNEFGWRISAAIAGTICIYLIGRIALRIFHNPIWATVASLLAFLDGFALVMSRTALLDIFLTTFILLAFNAWLKARYFELSLWLGLALATKWNAIFYIAGILILEFALNRNLFRVIKVKFLALAIYPFTWIGWFLASNGWGRNYSKNPIISFIHYHFEILNFHTGLTEKHSYQANPFGWMIMRRPTSFFYQSPNGKSQEVLALGTPLLWWLSIIALIYLVIVFVKRFEIDSTIILLGIMAGYLPWFFYQKRTIFTFYAIVFEPFIILALTYLAKTLYERNERFKYLIASAIGLITLNFYYFMPLFLGQIIPYQDWLNRMWFKSWI